MAVTTSNIYGKISISDETIAKVAAHASLECYGIVEMVSRKLSGVQVTTSGDRIFIDVFVIIEFGVSISAVAESLKNAVKYKVEQFTGMIVDTVNVNIMGVKL